MKVTKNPPPAPPDPTFDITELTVLEARILKALISLAKSRTPEITHILNDLYQKLESSDVKWSTGAPYLEVGGQVTVDSKNLYK